MGPGFTGLVPDVRLCRCCLEVLVNPEYWACEFTVHRAVQSRSERQTAWAAGVPRPGCRPPYTPRGLGPEAQGSHAQDPRGCVWCARASGWEAA